MCPISGTVQFLIVVITILLACHFTFVRSLEIAFEPKNVSVYMYETVTVNYTISGDLDENFEILKLYSENPGVARVEDTILIADLSGSFNITGNFLGKTEVSCKGASGKLNVTVIRRKRVIDTIFASSVGTLVSIIYINFGCALNWGELFTNLKRPIGPVIGFLGQFLIMPLLSFGLGKILFPYNPEMQLGMFFTGVSPAGGASNIWTVVLDGNMDLSITMTTISTLAAFGMMPLWLFTLGKVIFDQGNIEVPYSHISTYAIALVIPLAIGFLISKYCKKGAKFLVSILKGFSGVLLLFIIIFAIITHLYVFELFSWQIVIAGMGLPYLGYLLGYCMAKLLKQPPPDCLAIAIKTGIQNTGIAIFLLRFTLSQPEADLTTVAPVAVATMTPLPLLIMFFYKKIQARISPSHRKLNVKNAVKDSNTDNNFNAPKDDRLIPTIS
ncbi:ileal sodium/bile acid cotransporter [Asbolus verrucosus]|uniref:Ileal sodium/bile acid cotransporter n=1 Tax=Asbolus verrucosus TaxID=1661398 RepID=A0A482W4T7_ASBVE|nr:ileal sodium/bile acid cotransporter [Asbolus verrucosus]